MINKYISAYEGHWGGRYPLLSYPYVSSITFDRSKTVASLHFGERSEFYIKKNGEWEYFHRSKGFWIE